MKKMRNKGKVHPFTASSSSYKDSFAVLNLLPAAILALLSPLSSDDRHVLAYMLTRSLQSDDTTNNNKLLLHPAANKPPPPQCSDGHPNFDCDCFRCYTAFWHRWDSSPNRDLIHRAIEAFEDHFINNATDDFKKSKTRRKDKITRRKAEKLDFLPPVNQESVLDAAAPVSEADEKVADLEEETALEDVSAAAAAAPCSHKALARKVLPDVMGIFNSRLWSLWSPNV